MYTKVNDYYDLSDPNKPFAIEIRKEITAQDIEYIMVGALEGGIGYWARLANDLPEWDDKPQGMPVSQWATQLLLEGKSVKFEDAEDEEDSSDWVLTMDKLLKGIARNCIERPDDCDLERADASTYDCIIQFALFGEVTFG